MSRYLRTILLGVLLLGILIFSSTPVLSGTRGDLEGPVFYVWNERIELDSVFDGVENPYDLYLDDRGVMVIADSDASKVLVMDLATGSIVLLEEADSVPLQSPTGVFLDRDGYLYVADRGNERVVVYNPDLQSARSLERPSRLPDDIIYDPYRVVVRPDGRIVVLNQSKSDEDYQNVMRVSQEGEFVNLTDMPRVISEASEGRVTEVPRVGHLALDYNNAVVLLVPDVTEGQIVYAVRAESPSLRLPGDDGRSEYLVPAFSGLAVVEHNCRVVMDSANGLGIVYDDDWRSMGTFGGSADGERSLQGASSIGYSREFGIAVLLPEERSVEFYVPSEYGGTVFAAMDWSSLGQVDRAATYWSSVIEIDGESQFANRARVAMAEHYHLRGERRKALAELEAADSVQRYLDYSAIYQREFLSEYQWHILVSGILLLLITYFIVKILIAFAHSERDGDLVRAVQNGILVLFSPGLGLANTARLRPVGVGVAILLVGLAVKMADLATRPFIFRFTDEPGGFLEILLLSSPVYLFAIVWALFWNGISPRLGFGGHGLSTWFCLGAYATIPYTLVTVLASVSTHMFYTVSWALFGFLQVIAYGWFLFLLGYAYLNMRGD